MNSSTNQRFLGKKWMNGTSWKKSWWIKRVQIFTEEEEINNLNDMKLTLPPKKIGGTRRAMTPKKVTITSVKKIFDGNHAHRRS